MINGIKRDFEYRSQMALSYKFQFTIFILLLMASLIIFGFIVFIENMLVAIILFIIYFVIVGVLVYMAYYNNTISKKKYPNTEDPEEIKNLQEFIEKDKVKILIRMFYYGFAMDVKEIGWKLEKKFKIELHYPRGNKVLELKSPILYEKMVNILGFKSPQQCWSDRYANKNVRRYDLI